MREHRGWEKDYHEVTANHIVSAGESDKTQHFSPPLNKSFTFDQLQASLFGAHLITIFVTFYTQTARISQTFCIFAADF